VVPDIDSLPDSAVAEPPAAGLLRWLSDRWQRPCRREPGIVFRDADLIRVLTAWIAQVQIARAPFARAWVARAWVARAWVDAACAVPWLLGLAGILIFNRWEAIPLMAAMFWVMMRHRRRQGANADGLRVSQENERLLTLQQRFLQDASHQLKTPITIALGHSELLARHLMDQQDKRDIDVVVGELNRLRLLSERLLLIAASADPDFLGPEAVELAPFVADVLQRWRPTADRRWLLGRVDEATVAADRERLGLAIDALLENAVQHTRRGDTISLSVVGANGPGEARVVGEDTGSGIGAAELGHIFERFVTGSQEAGRRGTGLGLALVRAGAEGHGGDVAAFSAVGQGSRFELILPLRLVPMPTSVPHIDPCGSSR
jgi:signal transduction histidine kinase